MKPRYDSNDKSLKTLTHKQKNALVKVIEMIVKEQNPQNRAEHYSLNAVINQYVSYHMAMLGIPRLVGKTQ